MNDRKENMTNTNIEDAEVDNELRENERKGNTGVVKNKRQMNKDEEERKHRMKNMNK